MTVVEHQHKLEEQHLTVACKYYLCSHLHLACGEGIEAQTCAQPRNSDKSGKPCHYLLLIGRLLQKNGNNAAAG